MVSWALPGPVGAAPAGAAKPRTAAVNPPATRDANPNFFIVGALIFSCFFTCFGSLQLNTSTRKITPLIPLAGFDPRLAVKNLLTRLLAREDAAATDWHDHPMVLSPAASATAHRLPATPSTVHWGYF